MSTQTSPDSTAVYATLTGLVQQYSPSGSEAAAVGWLVARMKALGFEQTHIDPAGNAVGIRGAGPRQVVLLGHIDTVPGDVPVRIAGDRLYGRGAVDAKGPLAAFVDATAQVPPPAGWQIVVIGAVEEERDSTGARYVISHYHPDFAIIGEPSRWERITLGYKGSAWAEIEVRRPLAHTAGQAESVCETAVGVWANIRRWAETFNAGSLQVFEQVSPSLQGMSSGDDGFETWARLRISTRLPLSLPPDEWYARLRLLAADASITPLGFPISAYQGGKNTPLVRAFLAGIRAASGKPGFVLKSGTADINIVAPAWDCPAVAYGPGDSALDHTPDEHISLNEYARSLEVLQSVVSQLVRQQPMEPFSAQPT